MTEILAAILTIAVAWSSYNQDRRITELEERLDSLERKIGWRLKQS